MRDASAHDLSFDEFSIGDWQACENGCGSRGRPLSYGESADDNSAGEARGSDEMRKTPQDELTLSDASKSRISDY